MVYRHSHINLDTRQLNTLLQMVSQVHHQYLCVHLVHAQVAERNLGVRTSGPIETGLTVLVAMALQCGTMVSVLRPRMHSFLTESAIGRIHFKQVQ